MTSAISKGVHFKSFSETEGKIALQQALALPIEMIAPNERLTTVAFNWTMKLNRANAYDCFYLALADEQNSPLWTADHKLVNAVNLDWVRLGV